MSNTTLTNFRTILSVAFFGALIGALYTFVVYLSQPNSEGTIWIGVFIGLLLSGGSTAFELFVIDSPNSKVRMLPFYASFLIRVFSHLLIVLTSLYIVQYLYAQIAGVSIFIFDDNMSDTLTDMGFSMIVVAMIIFWMQMRVFIGSQTLKNLILGKYNKPQLEECIFMLVDVEGSTSAAQKIGDAKFHSFLNRLFILFDKSIIQNDGEVHSYIGDAILIVWPFSKNHETNSKAFKTLFELHKICSANEEAIFKEFGVKPKIRAVIHGGPVVIGEMGRQKRQITYLGNTLNLTARLEGVAKETGKPYIVSDQVLQRSEIPDGIHTKSLGIKFLQGSAKGLEVSQIVIEAD